MEITVPTRASSTSRVTVHPKMIAAPDTGAKLVKKIVCGQHSCWK